MLKDDLPASLCPPLDFLLTGKLRSEDYAIVERIERLRSSLARHGGEFVTYGKKTISSARVAYVQSVLPTWGTFLHLCANAIQAKTILELGSAAGVSGCYLASGAACERFIAVEGSPDLARLAEIHLAQVTKNAEVWNCSFEEALDKVLPSLRESLDMVYIDGERSQSGMIRYFQRLVPHLRDGSVVVFDDIHWSSDVWHGWQRLTRKTGLSHAINAGRFGVCVWRGGNTRAKTYELFGLAGIDLYGIKQFLERAKILSLEDPFQRVTMPLS